MTRRAIRLPLGRYLPPMGSAFVYVEVLGGVVLLAATIAALVWANVSLSSYERALVHAPHRSASATSRSPRTCSTGSTTG